MINIALHGCNGKMGKVLQTLIEDDSESVVAAGIDQFEDRSDCSFPIYKHINDCKVKVDVIIDFSHHSAIEKLITYCMETKTPVVVATTAIGEEELALVKKASETIPVFRSANMSLGINILAKSMGVIVPPLEQDFNIEIIEKHHNKKVDSPSGTALLLAESINDVCDKKKTYIYGRHSTEDHCEMSELGIHAVRGGTIPGEHTILFAGNDEVIEIKHTALSKNIFAVGALKAAKFLAGKEKGIYSMQDLI